MSEMLLITVTKIGFVKKLNKASNTDVALSYVWKQSMTSTLYVKKHVRNIELSVTIHRIGGWIG